MRMPAFEIVIFCLMLLPFAALSVAGVMLIRSSCRSDRFIILLKPWRQALASIGTGDDQAGRTPGARAIPEGAEHPSREEGEAVNRG